MNTVCHGDNRTLRCHECNFVVKVPLLAHKQKALCPRCGYLLTRKNLFAVERIVAFASSALICLFLALGFSFLGFKANGREQSISIVEGLEVLVEQDYLFLAVIQLLCIAAIPAAILMGLLYLTVPALLQRTPPGAKHVIKGVYALLPWSMAEIFLIGVMVSLIKISSLAEISIGLGFYAFIGFTVFMVLTFLNMDKQQLLGMFEAHSKPKPIDRSLSIQTTLALLFTSVLLYIPANVLPIMTTRFLGNDEPSTILQGVVLLWQSGSYPVATIIFIASVLVPVAKLIILFWLTFSVSKETKIKQTERIFWYRITEFIGRWSMVDVFVVAILVSLIQLGNTMSIYPGPAALAFCAVVVLTMLAAMTFDTRLIWTEDGHDRN